MSKITDERKAAAIKAIADHLLKNGPGNWERLRSEFSDVSRATFFRYIEEARRTIEANSTSPGALRVAQKRIRTTVAPVEAMQAQVADHLPSLAAPSPAVVAGMGGAEASKRFDFLAHFQGIVEDAELMRQSLLVKDEQTGRTKVKNPALMDKNIARRLSIGQNYLEALNTLYNQDRIRELYKIVIQAVGDADPETQRAILARLREANDRHGLTLAAEL